MKNTLIIILLVLPFISNSQSWFQDGDKWINGINSGLSSSNLGIEKITIEGDTIIANKAYKVVSGIYAFEILGQDTLWENLDSYFVRQEGDSIYLGGRLVYDFSMEVGDSIRWYPDGEGGCAPIFFEVDSLFSVELGGVKVRVQEGLVSGAEANFYKRYVRVYEGIGVAEIRNFNEDEWFKSGFLIPDIGLTCLADYLPPRLCSFRGNDFEYGTEDDCSSIQSYNSEWFKHSDKWVYNFYGGFGNGYFAREVKVDSNSIIGEVTFTKLSNTVISKNGGGELVATESDSYFVRYADRQVYYWTGEEERLVYDFNMEVGDTLTWTPMLYEGQDSTGCDVFYILDSIYLDTVDANSIQVQEGRIISFFGAQNVQIYEGIGLVRYLNDATEMWESGGFLIPELNFECILDGISEGQFCSYESQGFGFSDQEDCYNLISSVGQELLDEDVAVYPNPSSGFLNVRSDARFDHFEIFSLEGRLLNKGEVNSGKIDILNLRSGVYVLALDREGSKKELVKFVKM